MFKDEMCVSRLNYHTNAKNMRNTLQFSFIIWLITFYSSHMKERYYKTNIIFLIFHKDARLDYKEEAQI